MLRVDPRREYVEVNSLQEREVESQNPAVKLVPQLSTGARVNVLLVDGAPVDISESDHRSACYSLVWSRVVESPGDPFASLDFVVLGSAHVVSGLSC